MLVMKINRDKFYHNILSKFMMPKEASILVCGGGSIDQEVFLSLGYTNVTISNLDTRVKKNPFEPFKYAHEDVQKLSCEDNSYDYVVIHAAIHHCSMPHTALLEMYRVAREGILAFESRDSVLMRFLIKVRVAQEYEQLAVFYNDCKFGGVNNTDIPNYVFRWTEREIEKTVQSFAPEHRHKFRYYYGSAFPAAPKLELNNSLKVIFLKLFEPLYFIFSKIFYKQQNQFAFYVAKPKNDEGLFPWLTQDDLSKAIKFNKSWGKNKYKNRG